MGASDRTAIELMDRMMRQIDVRAEGALREVMRLIGEGAAPRDAIKVVQAGFTGGFVEELAAAFSGLLQRAVGTAEVLAMPVGEIPLSTRLYRHSAETANQVTALVAEHAKGVQDARALAMRLYDGYKPGDGVVRPLEGRARAELPKALRAITGDYKTRASLTKVIEQGRAQAARLKTPALRAAYAQAFDAWEKGEGWVALKRKLDVAVREKNRYMANRIAQTELARAHQAAVARELMADTEVEVVQVVINPTHPKTDICDLHARADLFGLGAGCYPKELAPQPIFHPFCRCKLRGRQSLSVADARRVDGGEGAYLRAMGMEQAAKVMGSRDRAAAVIAGASVDAVVNAGKDPAYRLHRLRDRVGHHLVK